MGRFRKMGDDESGDSERSSITTGDRTPDSPGGGSQQPRGRLDDGEERVRARANERRPSSKERFDAPGGGGTGAVEPDRSSAPTRVVQEDGDAEQGSRGQADEDAGARSKRDLDRERLNVQRERQKERFGGFNIGAAFFGWLVAVGLGALLIALLSAIGTAIGFTAAPANAAQQAASNAAQVTLAGGIALLVVLLIAYFAGGYVAGRMSRFDGARQGIGVWAFALAVTLLLAALGAILGAEYNVLQQINLPTIPIDQGSLTTGGIIALVAIVLGTLLAAMFGGKTGERYHKKVDRAAFE